MSSRRQTALGRFEISARRNMICALGAVAAILLIGTIGYSLTEGWSLWRGLFFTVITITTVGYGDYGLSEAGERFTLVVMLGGIGTVTYTVTQVFPVFFDYRRAQERRMYRRIMQLSDHFIICGLGRIGRTVCRRLAAREIPFVAVDVSPEAVRWAVAEGYLAVAGDATEDDVLDEVNIQQARGLACVAKRDTDNIVITLSARDRNDDLFIISRAEENESVHKLRVAGASMVISPTEAGGDHIARVLRNPELAHFFEHSTGTAGEFGLVEVKIARSSALDGAMMSEFHQQYPDTTFVAIRRADGQTLTRPPSDLKVSSGDTLVVAGAPQHLAALHDASQPPKRAAA